jgi:hypothetical protein
MSVEIGAVSVVALAAERLVPGLAGDLEVTVDLSYAQLLDSANSEWFLEAQVMVEASKEPRTLATGRVKLAASIPGATGTDVDEIGSALWPHLRAELLGLFSRVGLSAVTLPLTIPTSAQVG